MYLCVTKVILEVNFESLRFKYFVQQGNTATLKRIDEVKVGDMVRTLSGKTTRVLANTASKLKNRKLVGLNGRLPLMTEDHPVVDASSESGDVGSGAGVEE
jgi:hypothetical protein